MLARIRRTTIVSNRPVIVAHPHPSESDVLHALATVGAMVALADGAVAEAERDALMSFCAKRGLISGASEAALGRAFDSRVEQLKGPARAKTIRQSLRLLVDHSLALVVIRTAEKVAAADGNVHPGELRALDVIRRVMKAQPPPKRLHRMQRRTTGCA